MEENIIEPTVNSLVSSISEVTISAKDPYLDFPFLRNPKTITYIKSSKTVFIMRGVSGSGKSTIARAIQKIYPSAVLCSADNYFIREGEYHFSADDLGSAHKYCQKLAEEAVKNDTNVIIIDNTNVKRWEMKFYMDLARQYLYHKVIVEPKIDWRNDPSLLASRNTHDVDENTIRKKIKAFEDYVPFYYAWFLNRTDSTMVYNKCCNTLRDCIKNVPGFCSFVLDKDCSMEEFLEYFRLSEMPHSLYHCTTKFLGGPKSGTVRRLEYHQSTEVQEACGKSFKLTMTGMTITSSVVAAQIRLSSEELLMIYDKPEENTDGRLKDKLCHPKGSSAHLTIATAEGIPPKYSNTEILAIADMERNNVDGKVSHRLKSGIVNLWDKYYCSVTFETPIEISTLFSGF